MSAYGASGHPYWTAVQDAQHRDVDVLMLYPLDLVAVDERFGSWMTQYGYANYITRAKLLERGTVRNGAIELAGRRFTTLVALFEPFPTAELLDMMRQLVEQGGRVVWSGPPPVLLFDGNKAGDAWSSIFGVDYTPQLRRGTAGARPNRRVSGTAAERVAADDSHRLPRGPHLSRYAAQRHADGRHRASNTPWRPAAAIPVAARRRSSATDRATINPRSLGYETRNWFEVLQRSAPIRRPADSPASTTTPNTCRAPPDFLACRFPNGTVAIARHFREVEEDWPAVLHARTKRTARIWHNIRCRTTQLHLEALKVNGHEVTYDGQQAVAFRVNSAGDLDRLCRRELQRDHPRRAEVRVR